MDAYREGGEREKERESRCARARVHRCGAILQPTSNSIIARRVYSMPHPSLTRDLPREIDGERWLFSPLPLHAVLSTRVSGPRFSKRSKGKSRERLLCWAVTASSARPEKRKTLVGRKVFGRVMNLQIPGPVIRSWLRWLPPETARLSLSLSLCPRLSTQPPPLLLPLGCVMEIAFARRGEEGRAWPVLQSNGGSARNYYWANCILTNSKGVRV